MTRYLLILLLSFTYLTAFSQHSITGKVKDDTGEALSYATVTLLNPGDSTLKYFGVTKSDGVFQIKNIKPANYIIQYSFVGMITSSEPITIPGNKGENLDDKVMKSKSIGEVEVVAEYVPIAFKSDTVEFNTKAFETKPHAVAEDLLKKIPGIEVDESGNVKAMGEDVQKVLVDGKEFFGKDLKVATKNLPADAVKKVQVYDKKSEEADFMGIDDGVRDRTINLILDEKHKKGSFGDVEAAVGYEDLYKASAKLYRFSGKSQIAVLGMYNNVNEFGYSQKGHGDFGKQINGLNTTGAGGFNLSYNATDYNRYFMSYLGRSTKTLLEQNTLKENYTDKGSYFQDIDFNNDETDSPHEINFGIRHNFNPRHNLTLDGDINISSNSYLSKNLTNTSFGDTVLNSWDNLTNSESDNTNASAKLVYIAKLNQSKTQLKTNVTANYEEEASDMSWTNTGGFFNPYFSNQYKKNSTRKTGISADPTIVQEIGNFWYLTGDVDFGIQNESYDRTQGNSSETNFIDSLSADFSIANSSITPALSIKKSTAQKNFNITLGVDWEKQDRNLADQALEGKSYFYFLPSMSYSNSYRTGRRLSVRYSSNVGMPSASQLFPVINNMNPVSMYQGNLNLTPEYRHNINAHWSVFDQFSFTSLFTRFNAGYTKNKIGLSHTTNADYTQIIMPVNVDYNYSLSGMVYFSTPIRPLGIEINIRSNEAWDKGISLVDSIDNVNTTMTHSFRLSVGNRNKDRWQLNVGGSLSLTNSKFSIADTLNNNYFNTTYFAEVGFTPTDKWSFELDGNIVNYNAKNLSESINIPLLNAGVSYYFLKGNKGSLSIKGYDLMDKSISISQTSGVNYIQQVESNVLGRRFMLEFKVKFGS
ncbi:MAG: outer membrane beta-barrel protein [Bacteroidales bacterium]|nr:outer membrane beta-barrel protein [Bacteroidales bacterium]MCF8458688.1 outer membrane beta-barrel protein [Bacteroidales bacterium]